MKDLKLRKRIVDFLVKHAEVTLECLPEDTQIEGNASAIDPETDAATVAWIRAQLDSGNEWAWCCAHVSVTYQGFSADDYLGCCSYESEASFRACTLADMVSEACFHLADQIIATRDAIARIMEALNA